MAHCGIAAVGALAALLSLGLGATPGAWANGPMMGSGGAAPSTRGFVPRGGGSGPNFGIVVPFLLPGTGAADNPPDYVTLPPDQLPPPEPQALAPPATASPPPQPYWVPPPPTTDPPPEPPPAAVNFPANIDPTADPGLALNLLFPPTSDAGPPSTPDPDAGIFTLIEQTTYQAADQNRARDNWIVRGAPGLARGCGHWVATQIGYPDLIKEDPSESCDAAASDRAKDIANALQPLADSGQLGGYSVVVGARNGYTVYIPGLGTGSLHTYTVVTVVDANKVPVKSYYVDNYVASSLVGTQMGPNDPPNYSPVTGGDSTFVQKVVPPASSQAPPASSRMPPH